MGRINLDLDVLRSFVIGVELGSFALAAERVGRSTSAVSSQMKKLEEQVGTPIFRKQGRHLALTDAGENMLAYARRLLELNDEAVSAIRGAELEGWVRLGLQEDFGENLLPKILGRFARAHPKVRIEARISRNADLIERIESGKLDLALAWGVAGRTPVTPYCDTIAKVPMCWVTRQGAREQDVLPADGMPLALAALENPCLLRAAAKEALDRANIAWRLAFVSPSLGGLWAAVSAGLGVTVRTSVGLPSGLNVVPGGSGVLPALPSLDIVLHQRDQHGDEVTVRLANLLRQGVADMVGQLGGTR